MLRPSIKIQIGQTVFTSVESVTITQTWEEMTDTAMFRLPSTLWKRGINLKTLFPYGTAVTIWMGVDRNLVEIFTGYVTAIKQDSISEFACQDAMYLLKKSTVKSYFKSNVSLKQLLLDLEIPATANVEVPNLGTVKFQNVNKAQILDKLKEYGLYTFNRNGLQVGFPYLLTGSEYKFYFNGAKASIIDNSLNYEEVEVNQIYLKSTSFLADGSNIVLYSYYLNGNIVSSTEKPDDGDSRNAFFYGLSYSELKQVSEERLRKINYDGYSGTFSTFILPKIYFGDKVTLVDNRYAEREGTYLVKGVERTYSTGGARQTIMLDAKV